MTLVELEYLFEVSHGFVRFIRVLEDLASPGQGFDVVGLQGDRGGAIV